MLLFFCKFKFDRPVCLIYVQHRRKRLACLGTKALDESGASLGQKCFDLCLCQALPADLGRKLKAAGCIGACKTVAAFFHVRLTVRALHLLFPVGGEIKCDLTGLAVQKQIRAEFLSGFRLESPDRPVCRSCTIVSSGSRTPQT